MDPNTTIDLGHQPTILVEHVTRCFGAHVALDDVSFDVGPGQVVALLGPNGAGKSTLTRILATTMLPTTGVVKVGGYDISRQASAARAETGLVLAEERSFFWRLSGMANLEFFGALQRLSRSVVRQRAADALEAVGLAEVAGRRVDRYSTGMRARLAIARSLLGQPSVLLLDEPTRSLDPVAAREVRTLVKDLATERRVAVLYTTHDLHEAAAIASKTMILVKGRIARWMPEGTPAAVLEEALIAAAGSADVTDGPDIELIIEPEVMGRS